MLPSHWMKTAAAVIYFACIAIVLAHCGRLTRSADQPPVKASHDDQAGKDRTPSSVLDRLAQLENERKAHEAERAKRRAAHEKLEAALLAMATRDIPGALDELAAAAAAFRRKLPDLARLTKEQGWEREAPVKDALARARALTGDYYAADREAQKGREGPTLHSASDSEALEKRIAAFKQGGEDFAEFVKALPPLYGKVPHDLLLTAMDAIARAALPADAFDPCARDPAACPKPPPPPAPLPTVPRTPVPPAPVPPLPPAPPPTYCITQAPSHGVDLLAQPEMSAGILLRLPLGTCGITLAGGRIRPYSTYRSTMLVKVEVRGKTGWLPEKSITAPSAPAPKRDRPEWQAGVHPGERSCVDGGRLLPLLQRPRPRARVIAQVLPTSCHLTATGRQSRDGDWIEVTHDYGLTGWVMRGDVRPYR
jgi:hypothetical protein